MFLLVLDLAAMSNALGREIRKGVSSCSMHASDDFRPDMTRDGRDGAVTVSLVMLCQVFQGLSYGAVALFLPLIREDLHISFAQAGMLSVASTFTYAFGQIPAGYLSDRFGPKRLFFIGMLGTTLLSLSLGLIQSFEWAFANQVVFGVFRALLFAPGLSLVASWFAANRQALAMGLFVIGGFLGNIILSLLGPLLVVRYGWRPPFMGFALLGMLGGFAYWIMGKEKNNSQTRHPVGLLDALIPFRFPIMWVCAGIQFIRLGVVTSFAFWLPSMLVSDRGLSLQTAGLIVAMGSAVSMPSNALGGYVSDRLKNPPLVIGGALAVLACTCALLVLTHSMFALVLVVAVNSFFLQFYFGPLFVVPIEVLGPRVAGMSTGFSNMFANIGSLVFAYALGVVKDRAGSFTWGFLATGAMCLVGLLLTVALARMRNQALAAHSP
jgi:predicted MFS family arabinose efflux permease